MSNNKGITMTSLLIYVLGMVIAVSIIATLTSFFYKNVNVGNINNDTTQYTKFSNIFSKEIERKNNEIIECKTTGKDENKISYIIFSSGNQYMYKAENKSIYKNKVKICQGVENCEFSYTYKDSSYLVKVEFKTNIIDMIGNNAIVYNLKNGK